jgi:flagellar biogenesis protein FliO
LKPDRGIPLIKRLGDSFSGLTARNDAIAIAAGFAVALSTVYLVEAVVTSLVVPLISFALVLAAAWFLLRIASREFRDSGADGTRSCPECVTPISVAAKRCPHCTAVVSL